MKRFYVLCIIFCLLAATLVATGCVENKDNNDDEPDDTSPSNPWGAFAYNTTVTPKTGSSGQIKSYTYKVVNNDNNVVRETTIKTDYLGTETVDILGQKQVGSEFEVQVVETITAFKLRHTVSWSRDDTNESHPDEAIITTWIDTNVSEGYQYGPAGRMWSKLNYTDTDGEAGDMYFSSQSMMGYYSTGNFDTPEPLFWVYGGYWWTFFGVFAAGDNDYRLQDGFEFGGPGYGFTYTVNAKAVTVGGYTFDAYECKYTFGSTEGSAVWSATIVDDFPLPISAYWGMSDNEEAGFYSFDLLDLSLE